MKTLYEEHIQCHRCSMNFVIVDHLNKAKVDVCPEPKCGIRHNLVKGLGANKKCIARVEIGDMTRQGRCKKCSSPIFGFAKGLERDLCNQCENTKEKEK